MMGDGAVGGRGGGGRGAGSGCSMAPDFTTAPPAPPMDDCQDVVNIDGLPTVGEVNGGPELYCFATQAGTT
eukprot:SAG11_NODE_25_length_23789_cov_23.813592_3_plen_71_part_00